MAVGNTFGATVLSSYGGFWISLAVILIPGGFEVEETLLAADNGSPIMFYNSFALYLMVRTTTAPNPVPNPNQSQAQSNPISHYRAGSSSPPS